MSQSPWKRAGSKAYKTPMTDHPNKSPETTPHLLMGEDDLETIAVPHGAPPTPNQWSATTVVAGQFELVRPLGEGGMGEVFLARDNQLGRLVALKTMRIPKTTTDEEFVAFVRMFRRDAATTARLNHPRIVTMHQFGVHGATPFMVMEYVAGETLFDALFDGELPVPRVLKYATQLAEGMLYAHKHGVIHRDLKPSNLVIDESGDLKILDFGVAILQVERDQLMRDFGIAEDSQLESHLGENIDIAGTPSYMAPEQIEGHDQTNKVDIWAFGILLYEMLAGVRPFYTREQVLNDEPNWKFPGDTPQPLIELIRDCLNHAPEIRPKDFSEILGRLSEVTGGAEEVHVPAKSTNIVARTDAYIGRKNEMDIIAANLAEHQLVSVIGPGGVGKTRFVTEFSLRHGAMFESVFFADLSESTTLEGVLAVVADTLSIPVGGQDPEQKLIWALERRGRMLLVLDNCEQIVDIMAGALTRWSAGAPNMRFLVTSRESLGIEVETVVELDALDPSSEAKDLFIVRAKEASPQWRPDESDLKALRDLMELLDGLPLAIELAAARVGVLPPEKMLDRVRSQLDVLRSRRRDMPERQATLVGAIEWSWRLLSSGEKGVLAQLSIFDGSFTLEDAEAVVEVDILGGSPFVLDVLEDLIAKSLVKHDQQGGLFSILNAIRTFSAAKLKSSDEGWRPDIDDWPKHVGLRHCEYFSTFSTVLEPLKNPAHQAQLINARDNLFAALNFALEHGLGEHAVNVVGSLNRLLETTGPFKLGVWMCEQVAGLDLEPAQRLRVMHRLANFRRQLSDWDATVTLLDECQTLAEELGEDTELAEIHLNFGRVLDRQGDYAGAKEQFESALTLSQKSGAVGPQVSALGNLGNVALDMGDYDLSEKYYKDAVQLAIESGLRRAEGSWLGNLGIVEYYRGDYEAAGRYYERAIVISRDAGDIRAENVWQGNLGDVEMVRKAYDKAEMRYRRAADFSRQIGARFNEGVNLGRLGIVETYRKRNTMALAYFEQAEEIARELGNTAFAGRWQGYAGRVYLQQDLHFEALEALDAAIEVAEEIGDKRHLAIWKGWTGLVYEALQDPERARQEFAVAKVLSDEIGDHANSMVWRISEAILDVEEGKLEDPAAVLADLIEQTEELHLSDPKIEERIDVLRALVER